MTEERITTTQLPTGVEHTHTTIITEAPRPGGGGRWIFVFLLLAVAVIAGFAFLQASDAEVAKDNAVANAATEVGEAASAVGNAAEDAANNLAE